MPEIRPVTKDNWKELVALKVRDDQKHFVASNLYSIAESQFGETIPGEGHWDMFPYGMYDEGTPVGFLMLSYNYEFARFQGFILRLMVDDAHQGKGYGKFGMNWMLEKYRADGRVRVVGISYEPNNEVARTLYANLGFQETGEIVDGEALALLNLR
ncbi:MAG TPA: GNAT family N-acetyltransferase [Anaerolineales bacterium]|nr:GNAT family N-acetyltransferase [Anaerolineales bacterium]HNF95581.1 GNAT family N-acetyltransferase [Anaerolineales bacterium]